MLLFAKIGSSHYKKQDFNLDIILKNKVGIVGYLKVLS
jgi:hypothetical protein